MTRNETKFITDKELVVLKERKSRIKAPIEAGISKEKEKLNEFNGDRPIIKPAKIVEPDLEMAGIIANA